MMIWLFDGMARHPDEADAGVIELTIPEDVVRAQKLGELFESQVTVNVEYVDNR
ncbi:hypothetical protein [Pseudomonas sp. NPDC089758]|uniref:hypothetical protein n=1 Tax=Pseudomonas sp. NPDC089758 TaxID=3364473 RepID=UPI0037FB2718